MTPRSLVLLGVVSVAFTGCVDRVVYETPPPPAPVYYYPPAPPPRYEPLPPPPFYGAVWVGGVYYHWHGGWRWRHGYYRHW